MCSTLQVEIDLLTGATTIVRSDLLYDCGQSLNPAVDLGQVCIMCLTVFMLLFSLSEICIFAFFVSFVDDLEVSVTCRYQVIN